jgi:hypothetical protein
MDTTLETQKHRIESLVRLCIARLPAMIDPSGLVVFRQDGDDLKSGGKSLRYTAMTAIGLERADAQGFSSKLEAGALLRALGEHLPTVDNSGDLGLVAWAAARSDRALAERAVDMLLDFGPLARIKGGDAVHGTELAWVVTGLGEALKNGIGNAREIRACFDLAFRMLEQQRGASGLVAFARPISSSSALSPSLRLQGELGFFDAQVYTILAALSRFDLTSDPAAIEMATTIGKKIVAHQHPLGQWAWHYNVRSGSVVDLYPVYSVHQDGMAPMALLPLEKALGVPTSAAVAKGVGWLFGDNELEATMADEDRGIIWRSIRRRDPLRRVVYPLKLASLADVGEGLDLGARWATPATLEVDREMRPYHLGWCLLAFSEIARATEDEVADTERRPRTVAA